MTATPQHFIIHKPFGMLSQLHSNDSKERHKHFLDELYDFPNGMMPVGRLDEKSEGLLLMTTDGKLSDTINRSGIEKEYWVQVDGLIGDEAMFRLKNGVEINIKGSAYKTKPCNVFSLGSNPNVTMASPKLRIGRHRPTSWLSMTLKEGKFRQVRKMTAAVGFPTQRLIRVRIGGILLGNMLPGEVRVLEKLTIDSLGRTHFPKP